RLVGDHGSGGDDVHPAAGDDRPRRAPARIDEAHPAVAVLTYLGVDRDSARQDQLPGVAGKVVHHRAADDALDRQLAIDEGDAAGHAPGLYGGAARVAEPVTEADVVQLSEDV